VAQRHVLRGNANQSRDKVVGSEYTCKTPQTSWSAHRAVLLHYHAAHACASCPSQSVGLAEQALASASFHHIAVVKLLAGSRPCTLGILACFHTQCLSTRTTPTLELEHRRLVRSQLRLTFSKFQRAASVCATLPDNTVVDSPAWLFWLSSPGMPELTWAVPTVVLLDQSISQRNAAE
jgi:hypothetical protein